MDWQNFELLVAEGFRRLGYVVAPASVIAVSVPLSVPEVMLIETGTGESELPVETAGVATFAVWTAPMLTTGRLPPGIFTRPR